MVKLILKIRDLTVREVRENPVRLIILCMSMAIAFGIWYAKVIL